ncbi:MAG: dapD [Burkholderiales bacterium]|jgi:2,3,4,5-tetrahydropyridine-2-carboxylate N-succinyltransferase|nr:dapD [Burkholderiales bacterium]
MDNIKQIIEESYSRINTINPTDLNIAAAVRTIIEALDCGDIRVAEKIDNEWLVNTWIKKAILLSFRTQSNKLIDAAWTKFYDKLDLKFTDFTEDKFRHDEIRAVPSAIVRKGAYIGKNTVLMPSYVNIGAYIGKGTMVDTWATVGSCAQIGDNVHLSGGVGIGGVLEPLQANPTIIEDNCFIGARSEIVEGVIIGQGSVISMGVYIGGSTKIFDRTTKQISYGKIPPYSVVVPGNIPSADGTHSTYAAIIVKHVDESTRAKVSINELLRN